MLPDEPNEEERLEELPEDGETPFRPAMVGRGDASDQNLGREIQNSKIDDTYPSRDTGQQPEEIYDEGLSIDEPNAGNAVEGYDASKDQRLNGKAAF